MAQVPLPDVARALRVPYDRAWRLACRGAFPVHRANGSSRYFVAAADLPLVAEACGVAFDATAVLP